MLQYMGGQIVRINVHSMQLRQRALSKARWVEIRSSRMEIRLDTIGLLLAKPKAQNFETAGSILLRQPNHERKRCIRGTLNFSKSRI